MGRDRLGSTGWYCATVLALCGALAFFHRGILNILISPLQADLRLSDAQFGSIQGTAFALSFAAGSLVAGHFTDRWNRPALLAGGLAVWTAGTLCAAFSIGFWSLAAARVLVGLGIAALMPAIISLLGDAFGEARRARPFAVVFAGFAIGDSMSVTIGGHLIDALGTNSASLLRGLAPWRQVLILVSLPTLPLLLALFFMHDPLRANAPDESQGGRRTRFDLSYFVLHWRAFLPYLLGLAAIALGGATTYWVPEILQRSFHVSASEVGNIYGPLLLVFGLAGSGLAGLLGPAIAARGVSACLRVVAAAYACVGLSTLFYLSTNVTLAYMSSILYLLADALGTVLIASAISMLTPSRLRGTAAGLERFCVILIGWGLGPPLAGFVADISPDATNGLARGLAIVATPALLAGAALLVLASSHASRMQRNPEAA